ncbi:cold-shock protein [Nocardia sp. NBC_01388]|uniref:cold-shock protein n=1 Tax=Nocardia sp. NBC_01388 TaxID=2903596 RepID=UPI00324CDB5A
MPYGTVKWFDDQKGFGFIAPEDGTPDLFVHYTGIAGAGHRSLVERQRVGYNVVEGRKGPQATSVRAVC